MRLEEGRDYVRIVHPRYKYMLIRQITVECRRFVGCSVYRKYYNLSPTGILRVQKGYHSDGPSGPTLDTPSAMRAAICHDTLYQMLREGDLTDDPWEYSSLRKLADKTMYDMCREDGMPWWRAQLWYWALRLGGAAAAKPMHF